MNNSLVQGLASEFDGQRVAQISNLLGADQEQTAKAIAAALPMLVGSMAGAAEEPTQRAAMFGAVQGDHDGSILDMLGPMLAGGYATRVLGADGNRILGHVLGTNQPQVETVVAKNSGLSSSLIQKLLPILAPIVMGYIGRKLRGDNLDEGGLGSVLGNEKAQMKQADSGLGGLLDVLAGGQSQQTGGGGLADLAGDILGGPAGKAILGQILGR